MPLWKVALFTFIHLELFTKGKVKSCQAPEIRFKPNDKENIYANETSDIKLPCNIKTNGKEFFYNWQKDNKTFRPSDHRRMNVKIYRWLKIKKVRKDDAGLYTCVVMNKCGEKSSVSMHLYVRELPTRDPNKNLTPAAPRFTVVKLKLQQKLIALPVGNSAKLDCSADGYPRPWVAWYKNGKPFTKRRGSFLYLDWKYVLALKDVVPSDTGTYSCNVSNYLGWINHTYYVDVHERSRAKPVVLSMSNATVFVGENVTLICRAYSDAMPHFQWLRWFPLPSNSSGNDTDSKKFSYEVIKQNQQDSVKYQSSGNNKDEFHRVPLSLVNVTKKDEGKYTCIVGNALGYSVKHAYIVVQEKLETTASPPETNATFWQDTNGNLRPSAESVRPLLSSSSSKRKILIAVLVAASVFFIVLFGIGYYLYQRKMELAKEAKYGLVDSPKPNEIAVEYRAHGPSVGGSLSSCESTAPLMRLPSLRSRLASNLTQVSEEDMPLDEKWEIDRELISLQEVLGEGAFGRVMKAEVFGMPNMPFRLNVAVKMLKENATEQDHADLISELELMKTIGKHKNIINLIAASTQGGPLYVVVEYAPNGNLRQFLRTRRPTREYPTLLTALRERGPVRKNGSTLTHMDLVSFSYQVCRGMEYLSSKKCIHRDLAARNVLVAEDNTMKIADFGLSRQVHPKGYYRKTKEGLLPVMWMAVESLFDCVYNTQSDVWSFGILLWEMVTFGGTPYPGVSLEKLFELLKSGYRMEKPLNCPENMYQIMLKCWHYSPTQRPTFEELVKEFDAMLVSLSDKVDSARQLEEEEIHQEVSLMIPLTTRASNSALVSPSTPRNTGGTEHEMEKDGRNNDSVSPHHDTNVIWEVRNPSTHRRQLLKRGQELQSPEIAVDKKKFRDTSFPRVPIQSNV